MPEIHEQLKYATITPDPTRHMLFTDEEMAEGLAIMEQDFALYGNPWPEVDPFGEDM